MNEMLTKIVNRLIKVYSPKQIILFGSYAWGKPTKHSDIDLFIVKNTLQPNSQRFVKVQKILYGLHPSIPIEPLVLTPKELNRRIDMKDPFILKILKDGKHLYGQ